MRQMILIFTFLMAAAFIFTTGCITRKETVVEKTVPAPPVEKEVPKKEVIIIKEQPPAIPAPQVEVQSAAPSPDYVWIPGYWDWNGSEYVWISGKWAELSAPQATWVPGHWEQTGGGWMWVSGYWK
jgi:hypothetical protein